MQLCRYCSEKVRHSRTLKVHIPAVNARQYVGVMTATDAHSNDYLVPQPRYNYSYCEMVRNGAKVFFYYFLHFLIYVHVIYDLASSCFQGEACLNTPPPPTPTLRVSQRKACGETMRLPVSSSNLDPLSIVPVERSMEMWSSFYGVDLVSMLTRFVTEVSDWSHTHTHLKQIRQTPHCVKKQGHAY